MKVKLLMALCTIMVIFSGCTTSSGDNRQAASVENQTQTQEPTAQPTKEPVQTEAPTEKPDEKVKDYVLNTNSKKIHSPKCSSVKDIKAENLQEVTDTLENLEVQGYTPCGNCHAR